MKRRNFIKSTTGAGIAALLPGFWTPELLAAGDDPFAGPILLTIFAGGGWDHSSFSDPRNNTSINHWARNNSAQKAGRLSYAPMADNEDFFKKYYRDMLVFNGIDLQTGGHGSASRNQITGKLSSYPMINALYSAIKGKSLPLPWLLSRTDKITEGLAPFTLLPKVDDLRRMTSSNLRDRRSVYYRSSDLEIINRYRVERLNRVLKDPSTLPYTQRKAQELLSATTDRGLMGRLADAIPQTLDTKDLKGEDNRIIDRIHRMLIAAQAGVNVTSSIRTQHNFDSHSNHDDNHNRGLKELTRAVDYTWEKAKDMGIDNRLVLMIYSDVGRTPRYNGKNGKDHWSNGSAIIMKKNAPWGNRVVGVSGPKHEKVNIDPSTLQPVSSGGVRLKTEHVQQALRKILGIENHPLSQKFKLNDVAPIDVLNPNLSSPVNA